MAKLFDMDNPIWRFMGRVADLFFLTVLWTAFSLPVFTVGASTTALYYVTLKMAENRAGYIFPSFWRAFRENLGTSTLLWGILLASGVFLGWDLYYCYRLGPGAGTVAFWLLAALSVLYVLMLTLVFPLAARLAAGIKKLIFMTFMVCLKNISWVILMAVLTVCAAAFGVFVFWPFLLFSAGAVAYIHSVILARFIFPRYGWSDMEGTDRNGGEIISGKEG